MEPGDLSTPIVTSLEQLVATASADRLDASFVSELDRLLPPREAAAATTAPPEPRVWAIVGERDALVVTDAGRPATITIEGAAPAPMRPVPGSPYLIHVTRVDPGAAVNLGIRADDGRPLGGGLSPHSIPAYGALSRPRPGVPSGALSERRTLVSRIYDGAEVEYWTYSNPGVDPDIPAPVMVWLDGRTGLGIADALGMRMQTVTDNLVHRGLIPPLVHVLVSPAVGGTRVLTPESFHTGLADFRVQQYDEVSEEFVEHLLTELLPDVDRAVRIREDGYSRAIFGGSSGGTCAVKVGWFAPDAVSRIYAYVPSFDAWGWRPNDGIEGGQSLPLWVRAGPRRNIRVWMSAGEWDDFDLAPPPELEFVGLDRESDWGVALHRAGSQALSQFEMAQALKTSGYDYRFAYGRTGHNSGQSGTELPDALTWLWRGYDPARTYEVFEQDAEERARPAYRFGILNREP